MQNLLNIALISHTSYKNMAITAIRYGMLVNQGCSALIKLLAGFKSDGMREGFSGVYILL